MAKLCIKVIFILGLISWQTTSLANELEIKITGKYDVFTGFSSKKRVINQNESPVIHLNSSANLLLQAENTVDQNIIYGLKLGVNTTSHASNNLISSIYIINDFGRFELGSEKSAFSKMRIKTKHHKKIISSEKTAAALKINYFSHEFNNFQFGLSYTPDTQSKKSTQRKQNNSLIDGFSLGLQHRQKFNQEITISYALNAEQIISKNGKNLKNIEANFSRTRKLAFDVKLEYSKFFTGFSVAQDKKTLLTTSNLSRDYKISNIYGFDMGYTFGKTKLVVTSLTKNSRTNHQQAWEAWGLLIDHKLFKGLNIYTALSRFYIKETTKAKIQKSKYYDLVFGAKITF